MSKVKFELNKKGVGELMKCQEMVNILNGEAQNVQSKAGPDYETRTFIGFDRAHAVVVPTTYEAVKDNYENNTLLKALGGGR